MRNDKFKVIALRRLGYSYNEINARLGVAKGTLSVWLRNIELSPKARQRIGNRVHAASLKGLLRRNRNQTRLAVQRMRDTRSAARREIGKVNRKELLFIGLALYWAEGYKRLQRRNGRDLTHHSVVLTNSDPKLISMFLKFLREICCVPDEKIRAEIRLYQHMNEAATFDFWRKTTQLPTKNFGKMYYGISKSSIGARPFNRLPYGTIAIRVNNTELFHRIMGWIEGLAKG